MLSLSDNNQGMCFEAFNSTSKYLDDLLDIDNSYFEQMVSQIYPTGFHLNKANNFDTKTLFGLGSSKIYDKRNYFKFEIVYFPFL